MNAPVAVITVTYSPGKFLGDFLNSLPQATTQLTHVVLADNGSTDGAPEAAAEAHNNVEFLPTGGNIGYGAAINFAVRHLTSLIDAKASATTISSWLTPM